MFCSSRYNSYVIRNKKCYFSSLKIEHIVPLYERKSRAKFKQSKKLNLIKTKIAFMQKNVKTDKTKNTKIFNLIDRENVEKEIKKVFKIKVVKEKDIYKGMDNGIIKNVEQKKCNGTGMGLRSVAVHATFENQVERVEQKSKSEDEQGQEQIQIQKLEKLDKSEKLKESEELEKLQELQKIQESDLIKQKQIEFLNRSNLTFIHFKKMCFFLNMKENENLIKHINNCNFLKLCIYMNKKNMRNHFLEKEFLGRLQTETESEHNLYNTNCLFNINTFIYILEFLHFMGLNNLNYLKDICYSPFSSNYNSPYEIYFQKLQILYNRLLTNLLNTTILSNEQIFYLISLNDKYAYFSEPLFNHINEYIPLHFSDFNEHEITALCKHYGKILFLYSIFKNEIKNTTRVQWLMKRYICKSVVFSDHLLQLYVETEIQKKKKSDTYDEMELDKSLKYFHLKRKKEKVGKINKVEKKEILEKEEILKKIEKEEKLEKEEILEKIDKGKNVIVMKENINDEYDIKTNIVKTKSSEINIIEKNDKNKKKKFESFQKMIQNSSFVKTLNKELKMSLHEYKYYNVIDMLEFYTIFEIKHPSMRKRLINEIDKFLNIMKYGYPAKALILLSFNTKYLQEEHKKTIRRLVRRISFMLQFYWPVEMILEILIACCKFRCTEHIFKNLIIYLKNSIKNCIHPIILNNLTEHFANINKRNFVLFQHIIKFLKKNIQTIPLHYTITILKNMGRVDYKDSNFLFFFLSHKYIFQQIKQLSKLSLIHLFQLMYYYADFLENQSLHINNIVVKNMLTFYIEYILCIMFELDKLQIEKENSLKLIELQKQVNNTLPSTSTLSSTSSTESTEAEKEETQNGYTQLVYSDKFEKNNNDYDPNVTNWSMSHSNDTTETYTSHFLMKEDKTKLPTDFFIEFLKGFLNLKIINLQTINYALPYINFRWKAFNETHVPILFQFLSVHLYFFCKNNSLTSQIYITLYYIVKQNIDKLPYSFLTSCIYSTLCFYFTHIVVTNQKENNNLHLLENILTMFCNKFVTGREGMYGEREQQEEEYEIEIEQEKEQEREREKERGWDRDRNRQREQIDAHLLNVVSEMLLKLYRTVHIRMPHSVHTFCKYVNTNYKIDTDIIVGYMMHHDKQKFIQFFSDVLQNKKIKHSINYIVFPFAIDLVLLGEKHEQEKKALFVTQSMNDMYLKNFQLNNHFVDQYLTNKKNQTYQNEFQYLSLKPYESMREWFLKTDHWVVSYISKNEWLQT